MFLVFLPEISKTNKMKNRLLILFCLFLAAMSCKTPAPGPTKGQQAMIDRKYGMFLHFGMNTYLDKEWSTGMDSASCFNPPADLPEKIEQWAAIAKEAGMRSIVLPVKHHDGFCLWDSKYTDYTIAHPSISHPTDVIKNLSEACRKHGLTFSIYYSLWDRHEPTYKAKDPKLYITYMKNQLGELMTHYGPIGELWLDGVWDRKNEDWHLQEIYDYVKSLQPDCQISTNWTLNKRPVDMQTGDSIIYFPADFRLWDPYLPLENDPKIYTHSSKQYYLPFECTQTISVLGNWFYHDNDTLFRDIEDLEEIFYRATRNDNCLLLNIPPDKNGNFHPTAIERILELADKMDIRHGKPFPEHPRKPSTSKPLRQVSVSSIYKNDTLHYGAYCLTDGDVSTSWKCNDVRGWFMLDFGQKQTFRQVQIIEQAHHIKDYTLAILKEETGNWETIHSAHSLSDTILSSFMGYGYGEINLDLPVEARKIKFTILSARDKPAIFSVRIK